MKIDGGLITDLAGVPERVRDLEDLGYDGAISVETGHDPFLPLALAAEHSARVDLITSVAIALARSPMTTAYTAHDLNVLSGGRMVLGLGSQIKPHIEKRFSMPWSPPAARMREFISALRAIWTSWETGERLAFRGDHYTLTLMTPFFSPGPSEVGPPRVFLGALGDRMCEVAGEVADGVLLHPFSTDRYVRERALPAVERGLARAGRSREGFEFCITPFVATGPDEDAARRAVAPIRQQIAFYGSTPAYRTVLELHGWGEAQDELNALSKRGRWTDMADLITDEMLEAFVVEARHDRLPGALRGRAAGVADRLQFFAPWGADRDAWRTLLREIESVASTPAPA
ncbi:MAG TPA: TIGR03617 family F420-dependent LLM class oxidoreductase [Terriglobales bacterium]|nr:TIGR03617 family F420-dependent LLM class oxidoreductase [Terriglobales bacterium]